MASVSTEGALENMVQVTVNSQKVDEVNESIRGAVEAAQKKAMEEAMAQQGIGAVSYTHLDVYKRQAMRWNEPQVCR